MKEAAGGYYRTEMKARARTRIGRRHRVNDPEGTRRNIVEVATREFAQKGYGGARVDAIAERTRTSKRMIYYYFGGKEGLYLAVLEEAYSSIRRTEATLDLERLPPEEALATLVAFTFDYQNAHPEFVRLVMNENILDGVHMARSKTIGRLNNAVIDVLHDLLARGRRAGVFRRDLDALEVHMTSSTWPTARLSRPSSSATWPRPRRWRRGAPRSSTSS